MAKQRKVWKIRVVKPYAEAHNHLIIGEVLEETPMYVRVEGRTFHYGRSAEQARQVRVGDYAVRILPWARVEIVNELPGSFEVGRAKLACDGKGAIALQHGDYACIIVSRDARGN
jgi:hypothetical protein